jgi:hypothetical protein
MWRGCGRGIFWFLVWNKPLEVLGIDEKIILNESARNRLYFGLR